MSQCKLRSKNFYHDRHTYITFYEPTVSVIALDCPEHWTYRNIRITLQTLNGNPFQHKLT